MTARTTAIAEIARHRVAGTQRYLEHAGQAGQRGEPGVRQVLAPEEVDVPEGGQPRQVRHPRVGGGPGRVVPRPVRALGGPTGGVGVAT